MNGDRHTLGEYELEVGQCWEAAVRRWGRALVPQLRLGAPGQTCLPVQETNCCKCLRPIPALQNPKITCHSDSSINSQLISPVDVNPLLL